MKLYISGQITGLDYAEAFANFKFAEASVVISGNQPVNPMNLPHNHSRTWVDFMKEDIHALLDCDGIYMLRNWTASKGAIMEFNIAQQLGMLIYFEQNEN